MQVKLDSKNIRYPVDERPYLIRHFEPIPTEISELIIKNIDRQNGWIILNLISETGKVKTFTHLFKEENFKIDKCYKYFDIELHPSSIHLDDYFSFDLEMN